MMAGSARGRRPTALILLSLCIALSAPACTFSLSAASLPTVDRNATIETKSLFGKLWLVAGSKETLFGHQDDTYFGVGWVNAPGRSDILEVSGSYPAVYGWDVGGLELGGPNNVDGIPFATMRDRIIEAYRRGGVITISWHMTNPVTGGLFNDRTEAVSTILPGGTNHAKYRGWLDRFAAFDKTLAVSGVPWNASQHRVPVVFRPFHEHNGSVFWWGGLNTNATNYATLWRFTVQYLRDTAGLHNLLYAYSPDTRFMQQRGGGGGVFADLATFQRQYFYGYPGDDYVDVLGLDSYAEVEINDLAGFQSGLNMLVQTSRDRSGLKIPALTETGERWTHPPDWWTTFLLPGVVSTRPSGLQVAWALVWRNWDPEKRGGPYPGGPGAADFVVFKNNAAIRLENEIASPMYTWP